MKSIVLSPWPGRIACLMAVAFLIVGFWPLDAFPRNRAAWVEPPPGVRFESPSVVESESIFSLCSDDGAAPARFTVELLVCPAREPNNYTPFLLALYGDRLPEGIALCQWKDQVILRTPSRPEANPRQVTEVGAWGVLAAGRTSLVTIACGNDGTRFHLDGELVRAWPGHTLPARYARGRLLLGNSADGKKGWQGTMNGLALFNRSLSTEEIRYHASVWTNNAADELANELACVGLYRFDQPSGARVPDRSLSDHHLLIPPGFQPRHREVLSLPWRSPLHHPYPTGDVLLNLVGFVPFGLLVGLQLAAVRGIRGAKLVILAGAAGFALSLFIELVQVWLPNRVSSTVDLVCNTMGALAGGCLVLWLGGPAAIQSRTTNSASGVASFTTKPQVETQRTSDQISDSRT